MRVRATTFLAMRLIIVVLVVAAILIKGLIFMKNATLFGALLAHELVIHRPFLPRHLLFLALEAQN